MKPILKYPGAKNRIAPWICENIPEHTVYLEPFAGSLAVLFNKPRSHIETVNDLDGDVVNFFRVLREEKDKLIEKIELTPFARAEYISAYEPSHDPIEQARRFAVKCWMGFGSGNRYQNGFKTGQQSNSPNPARTWGELPNVLDMAAGRLKGVQIENIPAVELIRRHNTKDVFIYADPPYLLEVRKKYLYKCEMSTEEHIELLKTLIDHPGKVMISGYENEIYNKMLNGWRKKTKKNLAEGGRQRKEVIWMNYDMGQIKLFEEE